jgi:hypothetical protein
VHCACVSIEATALTAAPACCMLAWQLLLANKGGALACTRLVTVSTARVPLLGQHGTGVSPGVSPTARQPAAGPTVAVTRGAQGIVRLRHGAGARGFVAP